MFAKIILPYDMCWGGFTRMHTSSDSESVETNDTEEEDNNDET